MDVLKRNLLFVSGKGGVGKTVVSQAIALRLNQTGKRVLWATFEDPLLPSHELNEVRRGLFHINCEASLAFEEYAALKIGMAGLAKIFLKNKVMRYLAKAAPGIHELVLLGKVWFERNNYDHVIVDMPSTGYGLAMFQSTQNFSQLFQGGPIHRDADAMLSTFGDPSVCGQLIVSLPEEMPLRESLELNQYLLGLFPNNPADYFLNRVFPKPQNQLSPVVAQVDPNPDRWITPLAKDSADYVVKRSALETFNVRIWEQEKIRYRELGYEPPVQDSSIGPMVEKLARQFEQRGYL
jgi:anion-transporting  ArsA/GET3 family ATPase